MSINLWQHQIEGLEYLNRGKNYGLLRHGVATGKTLTTLSFIRQRMFQRVLIIGTKNSVDTWEKQAKLITDIHIPVYLYRDGSVKDRALKLKQDFNAATMWSGRPVLFVMNYEAFSKEYMLKVLMKTPFDAIIFDEVHRLRGHKTQQSRAAYKIAQALPNAFRAGLTGTVFYDKPLDVFGIMRFIDPSVFGTNWTAFRTRYALWKGQFNQIPIQYINLDELKQKVQAVWHSVDRRAVLDLPDEQHIILNAEFSPQEKREYQQFNKEFVLTVNEYRNKAIAATNVLDMILKLQQMTGGFIYKDGLTHHFSNSKRVILQELLEEVEDHCVVFYRFKAEKEIIKGVCDGTGKTFHWIDGGGSTYTEWLSCNEPSVLAVQISSGAEGIDLTKAPITIFYDLVYSYGQYEQALGRTSRPNQTAKSILYYYLIVKDSIDERIWKALNNKRDLIEDLIA